MLQPRRGQRLAAEAGDEGLVVGEVLGQQLDRDRALEHGVGREEDRRHAARAEARLDPVAAGDLSGGLIVVTPSSRARAPLRSRSFFVSRRDAAALAVAGIVLRTVAVARPSPCPLPWPLPWLPGAGVVAGGVVSVGVVSGGVVGTVSVSVVTVSGGAVSVCVSVVAVVWPSSSSHCSRTSWNSRSKLSSSAERTSALTLSGIDAQDPVDGGGVRIAAAGDVVAGTAADVEAALDRRRAVSAAPVPGQPGSARPRPAARRRRRSPPPRARPGRPRGRAGADMSLRGVSSSLARVEALPEHARQAGRANRGRGLVDRVLDAPPAREPRPCV